MALIISGLGVSRGIAIGNVHLLLRSAFEVYERAVEPDEVNTEVKRFKSAVDRAAKQLRKIQESIPEEAPKEIASFIESHLLMLKDSMLSKAPTDIIKQQYCNAEWALKNSTR